MKTITEEQKALLEKYDSILKEFVDKQSLIDKKSLKEDTKSFREVIDRVFKLYNFTHYVYNTYFITIEHEVLRAVLNDSLIKAGQTTHAIYHCLNNNLERDAATLLRSLLELYLLVMLIMEKDTNERIALYMNFFPVLKYKEYKRGKLKFDNKVEEQKVIENYEKHKDNYKPNNPTSWCWSLFKDELKDGQEPNLYMISQRLGGHASIMFNNLYPILSSASHSGIVSSNILHMAGNIGCFTMNFTSEIFQTVLGHYKPVNYEELIEYFNLMFDVCMKEEI